MAILLLVLGAGPRKPAPRDDVELVRYVIAARYPVSWAIVGLDPDCKAQTISLLEWLGGPTAELELRSFATKNGSVAADEVRQLVEDKIDRALARDFVRGVRPPPRSNAYWHQTMVSARDTVARRLGILSISASDPEPVGDSDLLHALWFDIARAAGARLESTIGTGHLFLSGDPSAIADLARWWLKQRAPTLLELVAKSGPLGDTGSTGPMGDWAERFAFDASASMAQRMASMTLVPTPHPVGPPNGGAPGADSEEPLREVPPAREAAAVAVRALMEALVDWRDGER
jgi:hypothetical protein